MSQTTRGGAIRRRSGIRPRIVALVLVAAALTMVATVVTADLLLRRERGREEEGERALARAIAAHVDHAVSETLEMLGETATRIGTAEEDAAQTGARLRRAYLRARILHAVALVDAGGGLVHQEPPAHPMSPQAWAAVPGLSAAVTGGRPLVSALTTVDEVRRVVFLVVPVRDWHGEVVGLIVGEVDPASPHFRQAMAPLAPGAPFGFDVVDRRGSTLASLGTVDGPPAASVNLRSAPWVVRVYGGSLPPPPLVVMGRSLGLPALLLLGLASLFAWGFARSITRPLVVLTGQAERMASGDLSRRLPAFAADEAGRLGRALEVMRGALKRSLDDAERARLELGRRVDERTADLRRLNEELQVREAARRHLLRKVITAQEEERKRLARDIHDHTSQTLTAIGMGIDAALARWPEEGARQRLTDVRALARRASDELRQLILDLRPSILDDLGLAAAIRWYADRHLTPLGIAVRCEFDGFDRAMPSEVRIAVFRAVQEAMTNIARHSGAESVLVQGDASGETLIVEIEDDGRGFDPAAFAPTPESPRGIGLLGMRERMDLVGGRLEMDSAPGHGTRLVLTVPLAEGGADG